MGKNNPKWKGDNIGYAGLHDWIEREKGKPKHCEFCKLKEPNRMYHWANKSRKYKRRLNDWIRLCAPCHSRYDDIPRKAWETRRKKLSGMV